MKRFKFYLWVGLAYLLLWLFVDLVRHPESFLLRSLNEIWRAIYIIVVIYLFFEHTLPRLSGKRIHRSVIILAVQILILYSWR